VQLALSTATPSLGGALPKLVTLKIGYEEPHYYSRGANVSAAGFGSMETSTLSRKSRQLMSIRPTMSLLSHTLNEEDEEQSPSTINVLATQTEASMSSTSFTIPRRSTIDADVSFFVFSCDLSIFQGYSLIGQAT
jgi:hypothetical protein